MTKKWLARITHYTDSCGDIDTEYLYDTNAELDILIENSFGRKAVRQIVIIPVFHNFINDPNEFERNDTIESLMRKLLLVDDIKTSAIEGASAELARSDSLKSLAGDQTNAQIRGHDDRAGAFRSARSERHRRRERPEGFGALSA